jgi:hypothetical protein
MFRLLVTGSTRQTNAEIVWNPLFWMVHKHKQMIIVHGWADAGVDLFTHQWVTLPGQQWNSDPSSDLLVVEDLDLHDGYWAAPSDGVQRRNQEMVDTSPDACFAFPDDRHRSDTLDCLARAWARGMPCYVFNFSRVGAFHQLSEPEGVDLAKRMLGWGS